MQHFPHFSKPASEAPHVLVQALAQARKRMAEPVNAAQRASDQGFPAAFTHLVAAVEAAFRHEEALLEGSGYAGVHEQRRDNALLLNALHHAAARVEGGDIGLGREVVAALPGLLSLHRFCGLRMLAAPLGSPF